MQWEEPERVVSIFDSYWDIVHDIMELLEALERKKVKKEELDNAVSKFLVKNKCNNSFMWVNKERLVLVIPAVGVRERYFITPEDYKKARKIKVFFMIGPKGWSKVEDDKLNNWEREEFDKIEKRFARKGEKIKPAFYYTI